MPQWRSKKALLFTVIIKPALHYNNVFDRLIEVRSSRDLTEQEGGQTRICRSQLNMSSKMSVPRLVVLTLNLIPGDDHYQICKATFYGWTNVAWSSISTWPIIICLLHSQGLNMQLVVCAITINLPLEQSLTCAHSQHVVSMSPPSASSCPIRELILIN